MDRPNLAAALDFVFQLTPRRLVYLAALATPLLICMAVGDSALQQKATALFVVWVFGALVWMVECCRRAEVRAAALRRLQMRIDEAVHEDDLRRIRERFGPVHGQANGALRDVKVAPIGDDAEERRRRASLK
ncbi:hypothetical protein ACRYCC_26455 [Actinomadura scrupuli]|uniref:hypothetical protein n=1 Tax=Actinomadura scrupuli TaxID=559629 RepID=UPI003D967EBD